MDEPQLPKNLPLRNEIAAHRNRRAAPKAWLAWLDESARIGGDDDDNLKRNARSLAQAEQFTIETDQAVDLAAHIMQRGVLYDLATVAFGEMLRDILLDSPAGRAGLKAVVERVASEARKLQAAEAARHAQEAEAAARQREARLADEIAAMDLGTELNKIAAAGVVLSVDPAGVISAIPSGRLTMQQRRLIESRRDQVVQLLEQRQHAETL
jgi:hypothetical protein